MKVSVSIFVLCVLLSGTQASLMDTLMTPVTWVMKGPSNALAWLRSGISRNDSSTESMDAQPFVDSEIPVFDNETHAFNDTDEISLIPSEVDPSDNFHAISVSPDQDVVDASIESGNSSSLADRAETETVAPVNDPPAEVTTMYPMFETTTLRTLKLINSDWNPSTQPITTMRPETPEDDEIREITIVPLVTTAKSVETTTNKLNVVELVNNVARQPRKPRVNENSTSSTVRSVPEITTQSITEAPKIVEKPTQATTTTQQPSTTPEHPPASLIEALANLTASQGDFRKGRQDYDDMPQPVYIPEIHGNTEKEIEEPQFEFHSELAKALGIQHNEKKTLPGKVNNFI